MTVSPFLSKLSEAEGRAGSVAHGGQMPSRVWTWGGEEKRTDSSQSIDGQTKEIQLDFEIAGTLN